MRFSAEWWTGFGLVFAAFGTITVMFCWWMDRRIARFAAEDAEARARPSPSAGSNVVEKSRPKAADGVGGDPVSPASVRRRRSRPRSTQAGRSDSSSSR